ncbi:MAG TPA: tryptophan synthase subunit alpha, partial [Gemmata sp.]|nr:tryptophan synthase subunit alpha [Gemmata sp.]
MLATADTNHLMNPIDDLFRGLRAAKRAAFMPFVTAGDPDLAFTRDLLPAVAEAGANLIEVGFPFSDPIADGPVVQSS